MGLTKKTAIAQLEKNCPRGNILMRRVGRWSIKIQTMWIVLIKSLSFKAVQNERQPRNTATIKPESLREMDQTKVLREHSSLVGIFG